MDEKCNHTNVEILKKQHASDNKTKIDDTMLSFTSSILPAAEGCHPSLLVPEATRWIVLIATILFRLKEVLLAIRMMWHSLRCTMNYA